MKVAVEEISTVKKSLKIEVPEEVVARELEAAYTDLNHRVRIPGFRPGKAPRSLLEQRFKGTIEEDVIRKLVPDYYRRAIQETGLHPVELPAIEKVELKKNAPLLFTAMVEITPPIELKGYTGLKVQRPKMEVTNLDVDKGLEALQEQHAQLVACPEDHRIAEKDFVLLDFRGSMDGRPLEGGSRENQLVQIGSDTLIPGFEEQLIHHQRGDRVKVQTAFPKDYPKAELAGRAVEFDVTVREVKQKVLPPLDDELARDAGNFASLDQLRAKLKEDLTARTRLEQDRAVRTALLKQLNEAHPFEVPPSLVEQEVQESLARLQQRLPKGVTLEQARIDPQAVRKEIEPAARSKVKGRLILMAIAEREKLNVTPEEVDSALSRTAQELKLSPEDVRRLIVSQEGSLDVFKARLLEDKAMDWVVSKAVIESA
ncbi:MAG TPA: trigger factor [Nitrospiria bacterium]|jgi:trigger factor|nr:trigger factor [Nitrospiria bacterium]